ncbi:MAG: S9 family peptidase, partial [Chlorobiales bacterium]|nr:S9 family peptidase [Chlorobiales bacterium]
KSNPEVTAYIEAENAYTKEVLKHTEKFQEDLYKEMLSRIKETDLSVPDKIDDYFYYSRTEEGKQYSINCRKFQSLDATEEVLLDKNVLAEGHSYFSLGAFKVSPDHKLLAYSTDTDGSETYTLQIKNLETGELLSDVVENVGSVVWANDNRTLFYTILDSLKRPYKVFRHKLGADPKTDEDIFHEHDESFYVSVGKTRSRAILLIHTASKTTTEVYYLDANTPEGKFQMIEPRIKDLEYEVDHHDERFFIVTNDHAANFKLMETPVSAPSKANWKEVIPHHPNVKIDNIDLFKDHLTIYEREDGLQRMRIMNLRTGKLHTVDFPEPVYTFSAGGNPEFNTSLLRFNYTSLVTPLSVYDYDMNTKARELKKQYEVLGGYDQTQYKSERIFAIAPDGTKVPISLVHKKGIAKNGKNPLFLYGYGSYGINMDPAFRSNRLSLIDRGFIFAIAHIRGGEEMGRPWYEAGKLLHKKNTFSDFIACAKHLVAQKYTSPEKLVISGGSAGGLLMGAVLNMQPDLFKAVVANVPFVDSLNTMLDASLPLTVTEYDEWGNPNEKEYYNYIKSYSPYDNVRRAAYPNMLVTAGLNDPRVSYWEPAKWVAKLRAMKTDKNLLLLKTNMGAGHSGASGRYDYLKEIAFEYAFMLDVLGIKE